MQVRTDDQKSRSGRYRAVLETGAGILICHLFFTVF